MRRQAQLRRSGELRPRSKPALHLAQLPVEQAQSSIRCSADFHSAPLTMTLRRVFELEQASELVGCLQAPIRH